MNDQPPIARGLTDDHAWETELIPRISPLRMALPFIAFALWLAFLAWMAADRWLGSLL